MVKEIITFLLRPLMNERGQMLGAFPPPAGLTAPGSAEETREYSPFVTSAAPAEWKDLIAQYQQLIAGGAGSYESFQNLQRNQMLEQIRNLGAARGLGGRSGVTLAAQSRALGEFEPRAAKEKADYMGRLIGDYGTAIGQGREQRQPLLSRAVRKEGPSLTGGGGAGGQSPFQYLPSGGSASSSGGGSGGAGGGGSASYSSGSGGGGTGSMLPGGSVTNFFQGVGGAGSGGQGFYGSESDQPAFQSINPEQGLIGGYGSTRSGTMRFGVTPAQQKEWVASGYKKSFEPTWSDWGY